MSAEVISQVHPVSGVGDAGDGDVGGDEGGTVGGLICVAVAAADAGLGAGAAGLCVVAGCLRAATCIGAVSVQVDGCHGQPPRRGVASGDGGVEAVVVLAGGQQGQHAQQSQHGRQGYCGAQAAACGEQLFSNPFAM